MTEEQIITLIKEHFTEGGIRDDGSCSEWYGNTDAFLKFSRAMFSAGYCDRIKDEKVLGMNTDEY